MRYTICIACALLAWAAPRAAQAQQVLVRPITDLAFGEIVSPGPGPGYFEINPSSGAFAVQNAVQIGTPARGIFELSGKNNGLVGITLTVDPLICDATYIGACSGAPSITPTHSFSGQFTNSCPAPPARCRETVYVGGRMAFTGAEEGRWTTILTVTADYQ